VFCQKIGTAIFILPDADTGIMVSGASVVRRRMKKNSTVKQDDYDLREEYDLSKMAILPKGRFDPKRRIGMNVIVLEPEIAKAFPTDEAVNEALKLVLKASKIPHSQ
jgi:hypothetical protein